MSIFKIKNRKEVFAWSLYDFANQPFTTIIVTFIYSAFFVKVIAVNEQEGTFLWTSGIAITAVVVSLLSPILGALADKGSFRKFFLILSTLICAVFSILLYFPTEGEVYFPGFFIRILVAIWNMRITYPDEPIYIGDDDVKNAFRLIKTNPAVVGMHGFVGCNLLAFATGMTFDDCYFPQNFEPIAVARSQQSAHLWLNEPEECIEKCRRIVDTMVLDPNK